MYKFMYAWKNRLDTRSFNDLMEFLDDLGFYCCYCILAFFFLFETNLGLWFKLS